MGGFLKYLKTQIKRAVKVYPFVLAFILILSISLGVILIGMYDSQDGNFKNKKVNIGIAGDLTDTYLGIGIYAIKEFDSSKQYVEFVEYSSVADAREGLKTNEVMSYIGIPDGFVDSVLSGKNIPLNYVANNSPSSIGPVMINECIDIVSKYVVETQRGIYALGDVSRQYNVEYKVYSKNVDEINLQYIDCVLNRTDICENEYVGVGNGLSFKTYYFIAIIVLMLLLWGMTATPYLINKDMTLQRIIRSKRIGSTKQILAEYLPFFAMMFVSAVLVFGTFLVAFKDVLANMNLFGTCSISETTVLQFVLPVLVISCMQFFVFEINTTVLGGMFSQLLSIIVLAFASGLLIPSYALPQSMQSFGMVLPTSVCFDYIKDVLHSKDAAALPLFVYAFVFLSLSVVARNIKLRRNQL